MNNYQITDDLRPDLLAVWLEEGANEVVDMESVRYVEVKLCGADEKPFVTLSSKVKMQTSVSVFSE